jgi:hypothetical protein
MSEQETENNPTEDYSVEELQGLIDHFKEKKLFGMSKRYQRFLEEKLKKP